MENTVTVLRIFFSPNVDHNWWLYYIIYTKMVIKSNLKMMSNIRLSKFVTIILFWLTECKKLLKLEDFSSELSHIKTLFPVINLKV